MNLKAYCCMLNNVHKNEKLNKADQFLQECVGWLRLLDFLKQENSFLKTRLSSVVDYETNRDFLNEAEQYQNIFLLRDEFINEIIKDAKTQHDIVRQVLSLEKTIDERTNRQQLKLRNEVERLERDFIKMKNDFNKALYKLL
jgi:hypothetical protein